MDSKRWTVIEEVGSQQEAGGRGVVATRVEVVVRCAERCGTGIIEDDVRELAGAEDFLRVEDLDADQGLALAHVEGDFLGEAHGAALVHALDEADGAGADLRGRR